MSAHHDDDSEEASSGRSQRQTAAALARLSYQPTLEPFRKPSSPIPQKGKLGSVELSRQEGLNGSHSRRHKQVGFQLLDRKRPLTSDFLSAHFSLDELTFSDVAIRNGIENSPDADQVMNLKALTINVLEPARLSLGAIKINSGFRAPALNKLVGGSPTSQHMLGEAADIRPLSPIVSMAHLYSWLSKWVDYGQLIFEFSSWIHVSYRRTGGNQKERLISYRVDGKTRYRPVTFHDDLD